MKFWITASLLYLYLLYLYLLYLYLLYLYLLYLYLLYLYLVKPTLNNYLLLQFSKQKVSLQRLLLFCVGMKLGLQRRKQSLEFWGNRIHKGILDQKLVK
jgi:hypothetical protein